MICSKCGQELKEGAKFCTKCGTSFKEIINLKPVNLALPITSIILTVIGVIGYWVINYLIQNLYKAGNYSSTGIYYPFEIFSYILIYIGIIVALIGLNKQKSSMGFIVGLIPCAYLIVLQMYWLFMNLSVTHK
jgi:hypothetical protein